MMISSNSMKRCGFSLIEMMVVLGLVGLLMAFAAPNLFSLISSTSLSGEGTLLRNQLTLAQQTAVSKSADVEIRFFYTDDPSGASSEPLYRAYQLFQYNRDGEMEPVSGFFRIRAPVAIHQNLSTLLESSSAQGNDRKFGFVAPHMGNYPAPVGFGGTEVNTPYMAFRFRPDGSTDLPFRSAGGDTWYVTLVQGEGALQNDDPPNYLCLQVNPYNGQVSEFRPN
ncbi:MAG: Verru_Chthon cassette protein D [Verrucomicrobiales bacterium]|nr:Verru_Chthon cassette protein D [Verrucomicrobiales bacterium]